MAKRQPSRGKHVDMLGEPLEPKTGKYKYGTGFHDVTIDNVKVHVINYVKGDPDKKLV